MTLQHWNAKKKISKTKISIYTANVLTAIALIENQNRTAPAVLFFLSVSHFHYINVHKAQELAGYKMKIFNNLFLSYFWILRAATPCSLSASLSFDRKQHYHESKIGSCVKLHIFEISNYKNYIANIIETAPWKCCKIKAKLWTTDGKNYVCPIFA